jgi:uncharacterized protein involved in cysteine biosynthesis
MLAAAAKAFFQLFTLPMRTILLKAVGLALVVLFVLGIGLQRLLVWLAGAGEQWAQGALGPASQMPLNFLFWIVSITASLGIVVGAVFLMPAVSSLVAGFFADDVAQQVEQTHYGHEPPGTPVALQRSVLEGAKTAGLAVAVYLVAVPFLFVAGLGALIFFLATAYLLSREYFELAAMRFRPPAEAKAMRRAHRGAVFAAGLPIALFVSIPIVNLATPLFGTALMVHMHKRLS